jgi:hypothetical protein
VRVVEHVGVSAHALGEILVEAGRRVRRDERARCGERRTHLRIEAAAIHAAARCAIDRVRDLVADRHRREINNG